MESKELLNRITDLMEEYGVIYITYKNGNPPQLWAWSGNPEDETSEPLFRLDSDAR